MKPVLCIWLSLLVFASFCYAASGTEAITFVEKTNHFLYDGEQGEIFPVVQISFNNQDYWVVGILSGQSVSGFVPVKDAKSANELSVPAGSLARRELTKTAYYMRLYNKLKNDFSQQGLWALTNSDIDFFNALADDLKNKQTDLVTVEAELDGYTALQIRASDLMDQLEGLRSAAAEVAQKISDFKQADADFFADPDTNALDDLTDAMEDVFSIADFLDDKKTVYDSDLVQLRNGIAGSDVGLSIDTKRSLNALASPPSSLNETKGRMQSLASINEKFDEAYTKALNDSDNFVKDLAVREKRSAVWIQIYGFDEEILEKTNAKNLQNIVSLSDLVEFVFDEQNIYQWKNQEAVSLLQKSWDKTSTYYKNNSFDSAEKFAKESKRNALDVLDDWVEAEEPPINTDLLITGVVLLIILLIILYVVRNREKFSSLITVEKGEEEVPIHEWEK